MVKIFYFLDKENKKECDHGQYIFFSELLWIAKN